MIIDDFNIKGIATFPCKTDSPLLIDTNAVLPAPVALQFLQKVGRRHSQCFEDGCSVKHFKFYCGRTLNRLRQF